MIALLSAALMAASSVTAPVALDAPRAIAHYAVVVEDIEVAYGPDGKPVVKGEASHTIGTRTTMYDLAGRKNNGALAFAAPRAGSRQWRWYSAGMFTTMTWF